MTRYGTPLSVIPVIDHLDDVRAPDLRGRGDLALEALAGVLVGGERLGEELDDDVGTELPMTRNPDSTHPARAEPAQESELVGYWVAGLECPHRVPKYTR